MSKCFFNRRFFGQLFVLFLFAIVSGCGSSSDITIAGVGSGGTGISGVVLDGYLTNATVFLDKNGNYQLDDDEPHTTTNSNGVYTMNVNSADIGKYPLVAFAIKGITTDSDTQQPIANTYVLSMPKDSVNGTVTNIISPMTSLVRELMETGDYTSVQQAANALRGKLGLPGGRDVMGDYIWANNRDLHTAAQNMTAFMGNQNNQVLVMNGSTITVNTNNYRAMMRSMYGNMSSSWCNGRFDMGYFSNGMTPMYWFPTTPTRQP